jgi:hypothetical protein
MLDTELLIKRITGAQNVLGNAIQNINTYIDFEVQKNDYRQKEVIQGDIINRLEKIIVNDKKQIILVINQLKDIIDSLNTNLDEDNKITIKLSVFEQIKKLMNI